MPILFFYFIGTATRGFSGGGAAKEILGVSIPVNAGFLGDQLLERLSVRDYDIKRATSPADLDRYTRRLTIPENFTDNVLAGKPAALGFQRTGADIAADYDTIRLTRATYTVLADLIVAARGGEKPTVEEFRKIVALPRNLTLNVTTAGKLLKAPTGFDQAIPGTLVQFTMLVLLTSGAITLTIERNHGILRRLASSPMSRGAVVLGKWGARMALGVIQISFAMMAGSVLFGVSWGPNLAVVIVVLLAYASVAAILGMLLGNLGRTEGQVIGLGVLTGNVMAGLGGCWWPMEILPLWAQRVAMTLPTGWTMDALHKLVSFGDSPSTVLPHIAALVVAAIVSGYVLSRTFRFQ